MLLGAARAVLARQQATLTLRFSLPTLPPSAVHKLQQTPAAVITGIRFKTTKAAVKTAAAKKTTTVKKTAAPAKKTATAQKKTATTKAAATKTAAKKAPVKATTKAKTAGSKSATVRAAVKRAAAQKTPADKAREAREKERARKATALQKEREKKAAAAQRAKEAREKKKAKEAEKKQKARERKQAESQRAKEKKAKEKEKEKARTLRAKEADARRVTKQAEYEKTLAGKLRKYLEASLVKVAPQSPPRAISDNVSNGFLIFMKENSKKGERLNLKQLRGQYNALPESEQKKYLDRAQQAREEKVKAYNDWIISVPGKDVIKANYARSKIRAAYKKEGKKAPSRFRKLVDPREPTKAAQPHMLYIKAKAQGTTGNAVEKLSALFKEWRSLTDAQKAPYLEEYQKAKAAFEKAWAAYREK